MSFTLSHSKYPALTLKGGAIVGLMTLNEGRTMSSIQPVKPTSLPGVRYREHPTRKHGLKPDRYYFIRYKIKGVLKEEGVGWSSEGITADSAYALRSTIRKNAKEGTGPASFSGIKDDAHERREADRLAREEDERRNVPFGVFFDAEYMPAAELYKKSGSIVAEKHLYKLWIKPVLVEVPLIDIKTGHLESIMGAMLKAGKSPATVKYAMAVVSQVWNHARDKGLVDKESPTRRIKKPKVDNKRVRFLTEAEADTLLTALMERSPTVHDIAALGIFCGARAREIYSLRWGDIDHKAGTVFLRQTKNGRSRHVYITKEIRDILERRYENQGRNELVFPSTKGTEITRIYNTFDIVVAELGFNEGVTDSRQKVVFHTTRHTFASWLVQRGVPIYTVAKLTGHSELRMVERYAHLAPDGVKEAAMLLEGALTKKAETKKAS